MRLFSNPYTGALTDLDACPTREVGRLAVGDGTFVPKIARFCAVTGKPLNRAAVDVTPYPGPESDRAAWQRDQYALVDAIEEQANEPNGSTLAKGARTPAVPAAEPDEG